MNPQRSTGLSPSHHPQVTQSSSKQLFSQSQLLSISLSTPYKTTKCISRSAPKGIMHPTARPESKKRFKPSSGKSRKRKRPHTSITNMRGFLGSKRPNSGQALTLGLAHSLRTRAGINLCSTTANKINLSLQSHVTVREPAPPHCLPQKRVDGGTDQDVEPYRSRSAKALVPKTCMESSDQKKNSYGDRCCRFHSRLTGSLMSSEGALKRFKFAGARAPHPWVDPQPRDFHVSLLECGAVPLLAVRDSAAFVSAVVPCQHTEPLSSSTVHALAPRWHSRETDESALEIGSRIWSTRTRSNVAQRFSQDAAESGRNVRRLLPKGKARHVQKTKNH